jgi:hypothetical protein
MGRPRRHAPRPPAGPPSSRWQQQQQQPQQSLQHRPWQQQVASEQPPSSLSSGRSRRRGSGRAGRGTPRCAAVAGEVPGAKQLGQGTSNTRCKAALRGGGVAVAADMPGENFRCSTQLLQAQKGLALSLVAHGSTAGHQLCITRLDQRIAPRARHPCITGWTPVHQ